MGLGSGVPIPSVKKGTPPEEGNSSYVYVYIYIYICICIYIYI